MSFLLTSVVKTFAKKDRRDEEKKEKSRTHNEDRTLEALKPPDKHDYAREYARKDEEDTVTDYNGPIHWWFVSTLFPLIAGTFGPMASQLLQFFISSSVC